MSDEKVVKKPIKKADPVVVKKTTLEMNHQKRSPILTGTLLIQDHLRLTF